jgi:hypothetical protein
VRDRQRRKEDAKGERQKGLETELALSADGSSRTDLATKYGRDDRVRDDGMSGETHEMQTHGHSPPTLTPTLTLALTPSPSGTA